MLRSRLENAILAVHGSGELLTGVNRDAARIFAVDILALLRSPTDPVKGEFIGDDEANRIRSRAARDWTV